MFSLPFDVRCGSQEEIKVKMIYGLGYVLTQERQNLSLTPESLNQINEQGGMEGEANGEAEVRSQILRRAEGYIPTSALHTLLNT